MSSHIAHVRDENRLPLLFDDCPRCVEQSKDLGVHLDDEKWARAWRLMLDVELADWPRLTSYKSHADKALGSQLYVMFLVLQRNTTIDPLTLPLRYP